MKCPSCGADATAVQEPYRYVESGLSNVWLEGIDVLLCNACGEETVTIPNVEELHDLLARMLLARPSRYSGEEVRFLRAHIGWSGQDFARMMQVSHETVSRWENDKRQMSPTAEALLRMYVAVQPKVEDYDQHDAASREAPRAEDIVDRALRVIELVPKIQERRTAERVTPRRVRDAWTASPDGAAAG